MIILPSGLKTMGECFAGIAGFGEAFRRQGFEIKWQVEIEQKAQRILRRHFPNAHLLDDVRRASLLNLCRVHVICGGFPCQDLSVAGKRAGIGGERSGLFFQLLRITDELRPTFLLWENVPGLLSSCSCSSCGKRCNACGATAGADDDECAVCGSSEIRGRILQSHRGADLFAIVSSLGVIGYDGAWSLFDAQFFGVAQRRQRLFGVFAPRDIGTRCCAEILALSSRMLRDHPASEGEREGITSTLTHGFGKRGFDMEAVAGGQAAIGEKVGEEIRTTEPGRIIAGTVSSKWKKGTGGPAGDECQNLVVTPFAQNQRDEVRDLGDKAGALPSNPGMKQQTYVGVVKLDNTNSNGWGVLEDGTAHTLGGSQDAVVIGFDKSRSTITGEKSATLRVNGAASEDTNPGKADNQCVAFQPSALARGRGSGPGPTVPTLQAGADGDAQPVVADQMVVRKLTPRECERLQGFPDDWTLWGIDEKGERVEQSDSARYEQIGNAVCVPNVEWIAGHIGEKLSLMAGQVQQKQVEKSS